MKLLEQLQIVPGQAAGPADINGAAVTGDYVSLKDFERCLVLVYAGDGSAGGDLDVKLYQATDNAGTGAKVLNCLETGRIYTKQHASSFATVGQWTEETQATADEQYTDTDSGEQVNLWGLEVSAQDLDADNGFDHIRADVADPSAAKVVGLLYILGGAKHQTKPDLMPSAL